MEQRTTGIILRTRPLTESSLIVHWLTRDFGRLATAAKGARRPKSPFSGKLDLCYQAEITFHRSRRSELHTLHELSITDFNSDLRKELAYLEQAAYFINLIEQTTEVDTPITSIFELFVNALDRLPKYPVTPAIVFMFELKLLNELGLRPDLRNSRLSPEAVRLIESFSEGPWTALTGLQMSTPQEIELRQYLHGFLIYHLGHIPPTRALALATRR